MVAPGRRALLPGWDALDGHERVHAGRIGGGKAEDPVRGAVPECVGQELRRRPGRSLPAAGRPAGGDGQPSRCRDRLPDRAPEAGAPRDEVTTAAVVLAWSREGPN